MRSLRSARKDFDFTETHLALTYLPLAAHDEKSTDALCGSMEFTSLNQKPARP